MLKQFNFCAFEARYKHIEGLVEPFYIAYMRKHRKKLRKLHTEDVLHLKWHCKWAHKIYLSLLSEFMYIISLSVCGSESIVLTPQLDDSKIPKWIAYFVICL